ncbi:MAG: type II toxin-antitoxin system RelE/ParE family toxin [Prosthecobacter sp.]|jgi:plasmid stabilization system protein ParE|uniref:type II toxin-antitoxin system RelE/ParE family toxin n=1 Tax=Prosthecobacter sp. TaxID=1965333 RepID=UPI0019EA241D|nr:type II toxin-antitoxin system RelE/ParE family toxin [Prosthecobacter sp.]MBE2287238.1 type II toxin-antitoxin system RelE/ParE family toxin [Prosthecobacter sp.]
MSFDVAYTAHAQQELEDVYLWIKSRAPLSAERWREELISKVESLAEEPQRHRLAPESRRFPVEIRQLLFRKRRGQFRILFTITGKGVVILSVRHHSRRPLEEGDLPF